MKRTFKSEDRRKDGLFEAWSTSQAEQSTQSSRRHFKYVYDGLAIVTDVHADAVAVQLDDRKTIRKVSISPALAKQLCRNDAIQITLGKLLTDWQLVEITSVGSIVTSGTPKGKTGIHFTVNPNFMPPQALGLH